MLISLSLGHRCTWCLQSCRKRSVSCGLSPWLCITYVLCNGTYREPTIATAPFPHRRIQLPHDSLHLESLFLISEKGPHFLGQVEEAGGRESASCSSKLLSPPCFESALWESVTEHSTDLLFCRPNPFEVQISSVPCSPTSILGLGRADVFSAHQTLSCHLHRELPGVENQAQLRVSGKNLESLI